MNGSVVRKGRLGLMALLAAVGVFVLESVARADVTLPTTGVDVAGHITALITGLGTVVAAAVGGYAAFLLIRMGIRWMRRATA